MCIIAVSKKGVKQPTLEQLKNMYRNNPDGAGYMYARDGVVHIHKGFMTQNEFLRAVHEEHFTADDPVVYHFRISTQAGIVPTMTHPFPLTESLDYCEQLDSVASVGVAHNGIIHMTSDSKETRFSDTALFVTSYMTKLVRKRSDLTDQCVINMIDHLTNSKWALMNGDGTIVTIGHFEKVKGILFSNATYKPWTAMYGSTVAGKNGSTWVYENGRFIELPKDSPKKDNKVPFEPYVPYKYRATDYDFDDEYSDYVTGRT